MSKNPDIDDPPDFENWLKGHINEINEALNGEEIKSTPKVCKEKMDNLRRKMKELMQKILNPLISYKEDLTEAHSMIDNLTERNNALQTQLESATSNTPNPEETQRLQQELETLQHSLIEKDNVLEPVALELGEITGGRRSRRTKKRGRRSRKSF